MKTNEFDGLLADLDRLSKAMPAMDDKTIAAASEENDDEMDENGKPMKGKKPKPSDDDDAGYDMAMGKSLRVQLDDGSEVEGIDGTELVKSLMDQNEALTARVDQIAKALTSTAAIVKGLHGTGHAHASLLKSMTADLATMGNQGAGRRATLHVHERAAAPAPAAATGPAAHADVMSKALKAQAAGSLNAFDVARIETYLNRGMPLPDDMTKALTA